MASPLSNVVVIGAGLGGCALALALSQRDIKVTIYESRSLKADVFFSGVILTPNGLSILDRLGILPRIRDRCFKPTHRVFKDANYTTVRKTVVADEAKYGYRNHRIWRRVLLDEMRDMLNEHSIPIHYDSKFNGVLSDDAENGVEFLVNDTVHHASLLIGSDGIYSTVRSHIQPNIVPEYTGLIGILCHIKTSSVDWSHGEFEPNCTIQDKPGALFYIAEDPEVDTIMIGLQVNYPEPSRRDIEMLQADPERLVAFFRERYHEWGPTARSIIDSVTANKNGCYIWPFVKIPNLERWYSSTGRVVILGDGAHGLPPSSGQGVNQALEDIYALALLLASFNGSLAATNGTFEATYDDQLAAYLAFWQRLRQARVDAVFKWTTGTTDTGRLPEEERKRLVAEGKFKEGQGDDMSWLYRPTIEDDVNEWLQAKEGGSNLQK